MRSSPQRLGELSLNRALAQGWKSRTLVIRREGVEVGVGRNARHLRETARYESPGAFVGVDEGEPPVATIGGVLL